MAVKVLSDMQDSRGFTMGLQQSLMLAKLSSKCLPIEDFCWQSRDMGIQKKRKGCPLKEHVAGKKLRTDSKREGRFLHQKECQNVVAKKLRTDSKRERGPKIDFFENLPDDLVILILCKLSPIATAPSHLINVSITCKRFKELVFDPVVLSKANPKSVTIRAKSWCESAHCFMEQCAEAGNLEACYILGMIQFYCLGSYKSGMSLMIKAAVGLHAVAIYSLAIIQFNGSGPSKHNKDLQAGARLCARAALCGHNDALRELGHCLQDGYGVPQNALQGHRLLVTANAREFESVMRSINRSNELHYLDNALRLLSDVGCKLHTAPEPHPANRFLVEWFASRKPEVDQEATLLCSHAGCGRPETRPHEFRRCSGCSNGYYCSRSCQTLDWKLRHKAECSPIPHWLHDIVAGVEAQVEAQG